MFKSLLKSKTNQPTPVEEAYTDFTPSPSVIAVLIQKHRERPASQHLPHFSDCTNG